MDTMSAAEIAATRHLLGLSQADLAEQLGVGRSAVKDWEAGKFSARPGVVAELQALRARHDTEAARLARGAADGIPIQLPRAPMPPGWYLALGARVIDRQPDAMLDWLSGV